MRRSVPGVIVASLGSASLVALLAACPGPKMPSGPPPEYEDPPPPSWLNDAAAPPTPAPAPEPAPLPEPAPAPAEGDGGLPTS